MTEVVRTFDGDGWERHCLTLLSLRYEPADLIRVPSSRDGDLGIEAFTRDGCLYQCYSPLEPRSADDRYAVQRDKLTEDISKLQTNSDRLAELLGNCRVRRYLFLVPRFDGPRLQAHANRQAARVKEMGLDFIAQDFEVTVVTDENYVRERAQLASAGNLYAKVEVPDVATPQIDEFEATRTSWVDAMDQKLAKLSRFQDSDLRHQMVRRLLEHYLASEDMLDSLRRDYPEIWVAVTGRTAARERSLPTESLASDVAPLRRLNDVRDGHKDDLSELHGVGPDTASELAWGTTAGWLMRCPLNFPEADAA